MIAKQFIMEEKRDERLRKKVKEFTERLERKNMIRGALQEIHDNDSEYQRERNEIDRRYHAELLKLEQKYLEKYEKSDL